MVEKTVNEAAGIFKDILEGEGTKAQNDVVIVNSQLAVSASILQNPMKNAGELLRIHFSAEKH